MGWCCWQEWNREGKLQVRDDNLPLSMYQGIVIFSQLFTVVANKDDVWCIHFLYVLCLFCSLFFFQQNCRAFRTISFIPLKLLSPYILFCFTFSRAEESAPDILNYIPKQRDSWGITSCNPKIPDQQRKRAFDCGNCNSNSNSTSNGEQQNAKSARQ